MTKDMWMLIQRVLLGCSAGMLAGATVGMGEALVLLSTTGGAEYGALFYAVVLYAVIGVGMGGGCGLGVAILSLVFKRLSDSMAFTLPWLGVFCSLGAVITLYLVGKLVYMEEALPASSRFLILGGFGGVGLVGLWLGPIFLTRTPFKVLLRVRGAFTLYGGLALLSAIFAFAPGAIDPVGSMNPEREQSPGLAKRPNVMVIMVDTLRADALGTYNPGEASTPSLDKLAADSVVFEQFYTASAWTRPSTASLFTSMAVSSHDTAIKVDVLPNEVDTLAEVLRGQGYVTGGMPNNINVTRSFNFQQGFDWFEYQAPEYMFGATESASQLSMYNVLRKVRDKTSGDAKAVKDFYQPAEAVLGRARDFIHAQNDSRWFLFVHLMEPHDPYFTHPYNGEAYGRSEHRNPDPARTDELVEMYGGEVTYMDTQLAQFLAWMEESGAYDDTVIVLTADHGEEFNEHGGFWHGVTLYEEQIHVPLVVKLPESRLAGSRVPWQVRQVDVAPTLATLAGAPLPALWQGTDLLDERALEALAQMDAEPSSVEEAEAPAEDLLLQSPGSGIYPRMDRLVFAETNLEGNDLSTVRTEGWKLITANEGNPRGLELREMYNVSSDPGETENQVGIDVARQNGLESQVVEQVKAATAAGVSGTTAELDDVTLERMRALGYVE